MEAIKDQGNKTWNRTHEIWTKVDSVILLKRVQDLGVTIIVRWLALEPDLCASCKTQQSILTSPRFFPLLYHITYGFIAPW